MSEEFIEIKLAKDYELKKGKIYTVYFDGVIEEIQILN